MKAIFGNHLKMFMFNQNLKWTKMLLIMMMNMIIMASMMINMFISKMSIKMIMISTMISMTKSREMNMIRVRNNTCYLKTIT